MRWARPPRGDDDRARTGTVALRGRRGDSAGRSVRPPERRLTAFASGKPLGSGESCAGPSPSVRWFRRLRAGGAGPGGLGPGWFRWRQRRSGRRGRVRQQRGRGRLGCGGQGGRAAGDAADAGGGVCFSFGHGPRIPPIAGGIPPFAQATAAVRWVGTRAPGRPGGGRPVGAGPRRSGGLSVIRGAPPRSPVRWGRGPPAPLRTRPVRPGRPPLHAPPGALTR